jgi:hypothetical protein
MSLHPVPVLDFHLDSASVVSHLCLFVKYFSNTAHHIGILISTLAWIY